MITFYQYIKHNSKTKQFYFFNVIQFIIFLLFLTGFFIDSAQNHSQWSFFETFSQIVFIIVYSWFFFKHKSIKNENKEQTVFYLLKSFINQKEKKTYHKNGIINFLIAVFVNFVILKSLLNIVYFFIIIGLIIFYN
jgi:hypothetical protein